jgi:LmbE family N-acetylglucosaminyl deacetylase
MQAAVGKTILVVSVTAADPPVEEISSFAQELHHRWKTDMDSVSVRRQEDIEACILVGADYLHWDLPDCVYRHHPSDNVPLYATEQSLFGPLNPVEFPLVVQLAQRMATLPAHDRLLVPFGAGNHVDHQLTRLAAEKWLDQSSVAVYYEEYPYVQDRGALKFALDRETDWQAEVISISTDALATKIEAITLYRSQLSTFFLDRDDLTRQIENYTAKVGGERIWRKAGNFPARGISDPT